MSDNNQVVPETTGPAAAPPPGNTPIPQPRRSFRPASSTLSVSSVPAQAFPAAQGATTLIHAVPGVRFYESPDPEPSNVVPSFLAAQAMIYVACQQLSVTDRFLKECGSYHPILVEAYCEFIFYYHILRCRSQLGQLDHEEHVLFSILNEHYPATRLPVPGFLVPALQAITNTESPYPWQGKIGPSLPPIAHASTARSFRPDNNVDIVTPIIPWMFGEFRALVSTDAIAPGQEITFDRHLHGLNGNRINNDSIDRFLINTPNARFPSASNARVDIMAKAFYRIPAANFAANVLSTYKLDFPRAAGNIEQNTSVNLAQFLGLVDPPSAAQRSDNFRAWPMQLVPMMSIIGKFVEDSRYLSGIATSGLGATTPIWTYSAGLFLVDDPRSAEDDQPLPVVRVATRHVAQLTATAASRDPQLTELAGQISAVSQVNVSFSDTAGFPADVTLRSGPFWTSPVVESCQDVHLANRIISFVPSMVTSVARK
nr:capsid protein [Heterobasidion partitivirus 4]